MALLVMFGKAPLTLSLVIACSLASLGVFVSSLDSESIRRIYLRVMTLINGDDRLRT